MSDFRESAVDMAAVVLDAFGVPATLNTVQGNHALSVVIQEQGSMTGQYNQIPLEHTQIQFDVAFTVQRGDQVVTADRTVELLEPVIQSPGSGLQVWVVRNG